MRMVFVCLLWLTATVSAFDLELGLDGLSQAIATGQTGLEARRTAFHRPYRVAIGQPPLDYIDVVTPFRRVVLAAEARLLAGERLFGQREALATLGDSPEQVDLRLELSFHPLNTFIGVPVYDVELTSVRDRQALDPRGIERFPRFGPRVNGQPRSSPTQAAAIIPGQTQPLLGGTIVATFDGRQINRTGTYDVIVREGGQTLARGQVDFSALR